MNTFELAQAASVAEARSLVAEKKNSVLKAGGIDLLDRMKERLIEPARVVNLRTIGGLDTLEVLPDGALRLGPLNTLAAVAASDVVRSSHPALAEACGEAASPQIRNVATIGGNVLQRPRCWYYRLETYKCLKKGGDTCFAIAGENRYHVIFGGGPSFAAHPSNAAIALVAYGASFVIAGSQGERTVAAEEFFTLPRVDVRRENSLQEGEVLTEIRVPKAPAGLAGFASFREKQSFDWPLVALSAVLGIEASVVKSARLVLGAVAPIPWRVPKAEALLVGRALNAASIAAAAKEAIVGATPLAGNGYKVGMVETLVKRTLTGLQAARS